MKKHILYPILLLSILLACRGKSKPDPGPLPDTRIEWKQKNQHFGTIASGEIVSHTFYFKNTGAANLIIRDVETSCGCTAVNYDKAPIPPGREGKIEIEFNSEGRYGKQYKEIRIFANIPEKTATLSFTAEVQNR